ncbi:hypothetical protein BB560_000930 [Smittium megazygosporum]|uniref:Postreplication repair E3 ubiquitin-protein ligase RAD18 n=1 Tax=Smittium megazygosporum TaxID=133381 RepID=A0A2T9ZJ75_9FUNG|nr:hypothetical protein BB560_000930 [Smittium megazygosporum]
MKEDSIDDPSEWPSGFPELREMDELLRCPICHEFLDATLMSENCSHVYCSLCIRRSLNVKKQCPCCFFDLNENQLLQVRHLDQVVSVFKKARTNLLGAIESLAKANNDENVQTVEKDNSLQHISYENKNLTVADNKTPEFLEEDDFVPSQRNSLMKKRKFEESLVKMVECPKCGKFVSEPKLNIHLDDCLDIESSSVQPKGKPSISLFSVFGNKRKEKAKKNRIITFFTKTNETGVFSFVRFQTPENIKGIFK